MGWSEGEEGQRIGGSEGQKGGNGDVLQRFSQIYGMPLHKFAKINGVAHQVGNDVGQLWENFVVAERMKRRAYASIYANVDFWRTYDGQEVDLVEEREGRLFGYECKWSTKKPVSAPRSWLGAYPEAEFAAITPENYLDFVMWAAS